MMTNAPAVVRVASFDPKIIRVLVPGIPGPAGGLNTLYTAPPTGAVARTMFNRLTDRISLADFGVNPTMSASAVTTALNAAITAGNGGEYDTLIIPDGTWQLISGQVLPLMMSTAAGFTIRGNGRSSTFQFLDGCNGIRVG